MNIPKFLARRRLSSVSLLAGLALLFLAGCGPAPLGTSWAGLSTINGGRDILVAFNDRLVMVDTAQGKTVQLRNQEGEVRLDDQGNPRVWDVRINNAPNTFFASPLQLSPEELLAISYNQQLYRINLDSARIENAGGTAITGYTGHVVADLLVSGDLIYVGMSSKNLVALNQNDLSVEWSVSTGHGVWSKPLLVDGVLYISSLDHHLYAVDAVSGDLIWRLNLAGAVPSAPTYDQGFLYVGSFARKIYQISLDGEIVGQHDTLDWIWGTPVVRDGILYAADVVGNVYALDTTRDLEQIWSVKVAAMTIRPSPVVTADYIIVASRDHKVYWLNRDDGSQVLDNEGRPLVRELQAPIFADLLLIEPGESVDITEPYLIVSTLSPSQMLVAYTVDQGRLMWVYAFQ